MALLTIGGLGAAPGIGLGTAHLYRQSGLSTSSHEALSASERLPLAARGAELVRWRQALAAAAVQLTEVGARIEAEAGLDASAIFEAQALFLADPALVDPVATAILEGHPVLVALDTVFEAAALDLAALPDDYMKARAADVRDVRSRLAGLLGAAPIPSLAELAEGMIVIAHDLTPSDMANLNPSLVRGIVLAGGTPTAHAAILARGLGLPLVLAAGDAIWQLREGQSVIVDGTNGALLVEPSAEEQAAFAGRLRDLQASAAQARDDSHLPAVTRDGRRLEVFANASSVAEARMALEHGAEGIGLLRTEFLLAALRGDTPPDEHELAAAYGAILAVMGERPVVVRAMDAGGDKPLHFLDFGQEANPFLGWRGIRVLLDRPDLFATQTRALLRAAARHGSDLRLMFPMIAGLDEFVRAKHLVEEAHADSRIVLAHPLRIGVMIEVPAAALIADSLAREADFFSIGTNDLVQYTLAVDRGNVRVAPLATFVHPAVLRLLDMTVRAAHAAGRTIGVCGEAAGDPEALPLLVGLGVDELSVSPSHLPTVRQQVRSLDYNRLRSLAAHACTLGSAGQVTTLLESLRDP